MIHRSPSKKDFVLKLNMQEHFNKLRYFDPQNLNETQSDDNQNLFFKYEY